MITNVKVKSRHIKLALILVLGAYPIIRTPEKTPHFNAGDESGY